MGKDSEETDNDKTKPLIGLKSEPGAGYRFLIGRSNENDYKS